MKRLLRPELVGLCAALLSLLVGVAMSKATFPDPLSALAAQPRPAATATPLPTPGWWDELVPATPELRPLPPITKPSLSESGGMSADGSPVPFEIRACPAEGVHITAITRHGVWWVLDGQATLPHLWYWKVELSPDGTHWVQLYRSEEGVSAGKLMDFHTGTVPKGAYVMRLTAVDKTGNYPEPCVVGVEV